MPPTRKGRGLLCPQAGGHLNRPPAIPGFCIVTAPRGVNVMAIVDMH